MRVDLPPIPDVPGDAHALLHLLARRVEAIDSEILRLARLRALALAELSEKLATR